MKQREGKDTALKVAGSLLAEIGRLEDEIAARREEAEARIRELRDAQQKLIQPLYEKLIEHDRALTRLMKEQKAEIFDVADRVKLESGILLYGRSFKISIPRGALEAIEARGWTEAIRVAKSVDRAVVESWPLDRLVEIGARRKTVESFSYEVFGEKGGGK